MRNRMKKVRPFHVSLMIHAAIIIILGALLLLGRMYGCSMRGFY